jgi:plastocyanin
MLDTPVASLRKCYFLIGSALSRGCKLEATPKKTTNYTKIIVSVLIVIAIGAGIGIASAGIYQLTTGSPIFSLSSSTTGGSSVSVSMPNGVGTSQGLNFVPASVTVAKGGSVVWKNNDNVPHTVTSTSVPSGASSFDSGNMNANATYTVTFRVTGTYNYVCSYHPWMHGTVIVTG